MKRTIVLIIAVCLVASMNPAFGAHRSQKRKSTTPAAPEKAYCWTININDDVNMTAEDGTKYKLTMILDVKHIGFDQGGEYKGTSTIISKGYKAGVGALMTLETKNVSISLPEIPGDTPLAPLDLQTKIEPFEIRGNLVYELKTAKTSLLPDKNASGKAARTFTLPYSLFTPVPGFATEEELQEKGLVYMVITLAGPNPHQVQFRGKIYYQKQ